MSNPTLTIPPDVINPIVEAKINEAVIAALGDRGAIIEKAIASILGTRVDESGNPTRYTHHSRTWLDWAVQDAMRKAISAAIKEAIAGHEKLIRDRLVTELRKKNSPLVRDLVRSMTGGISRAAASRYRLTVQVVE